MKTFKTGAGNVSVIIFQTTEEAGNAAALKAKEIINKAIRQKDLARIIVATGPAHETLIKPLAKMLDIAWDKVEVFHMDEYVGISDTHPASFRFWLKNWLVDKVNPKAVYYMPANAPDLETAMREYGSTLARASIDVCFVGFGENGHIAFNDPHAADFHDPLLVKKVALADSCKKQQVGEGHFKNIGAVPAEALTITCSTIMNCENLVCLIPEKRKARTVKKAIEGPLSPSCPASLVFTHNNAHVYLDKESASLLSR
ncbi:MAG: 6-phosphogluconolactonase [Candidatus Ratteibacteria bacterium]|jgi:glucosamine-6-phosphate deaminase